MAKEDDLKKWQTLSANAWQIFLFFQKYPALKAQCKYEAKIRPILRILINFEINPKLLLGQRSDPLFCIMSDIDHFNGPTYLRPNDFKYYRDYVLGTIKYLEDFKLVDAAALDELKAKIYDLGSEKNISEEKPADWRTLEYPEKVSNRLKGVLFFKAIETEESVAETGPTEEEIEAYQKMRARTAVPEDNALYKLKDGKTTIICGFSFKNEGEDPEIDAAVDEAMRAIQKAKSIDEVNSVFDSYKQKIEQMLSQTLAQSIQHRK
jgi:hypothetical protein